MTVMERAAGFGRASALLAATMLLAACGRDEPAAESSTPAAASPAGAAQPTNVNVGADGIILHGYDAVAYQTENKPVKGSPEFTATHNGATYHFASAANRDAFTAAPNKYAPAYGGFCAMGVAVNKRLDVDPEAFTVANGTLYVNVNKDIRSQWAKDIPGNNAKADANWPALSQRSGFDTM